MAHGKLGFRAKLRETLAANNRAMDFYAQAGDPNYGPEVDVANAVARKERHEKFEAERLAATPTYAPTRGPKRNFSKPEELEAAILNDVATMLHGHPLVAFAVRQNSGSASYEAKTGKWAPVNFYNWIARPEKMRIVDIWGLLKTGKLFALECKRANWKEPRDDREREQAAFIECVKGNGGVGGFCRSAAEAHTILSTAI